MFGWEFPPFNSGGLGVACLGLTRALAQTGAQITFVMPKKLDVGAPWAKLVFADNVILDQFNSALSAYATDEHYKGSGTYGQDLFSEVTRYAEYGGEIARSQEYDVIYAHEWLSFGAGMKAKEISGKPLIVHVHATEFDRTGGQGVNQHVYDIERAGMHEANRVIAVSEYTKNIIVEKYGVPAEKVSVVYNGIDETTAPRHKEDLSRLRALKKSGQKLVLFLGRITLQKGPDYFLRAAKRVLEYNKDVFFIVSGSGDMEKDMMIFASQLGIAHRVFFTGFLVGQDRDEIYAAADLFVMPSVSEPFGIAALEAMRMGKPTLISKQSGIAEVVNNALKVDFWDVEKMAEGIISILKSPALKYSMGEHGKREANRITWDDAAHKVNGIVQDLLVSSR
ncbi:glycosyltransferase family 1 protein [Candidatus Parcubacteria bacterium]|nr:MAG: glycosyltransferase family 1 protein [Candidatus Parcubacteria bacterium]